MTRCNETVWNSLLKVDVTSAQQFFLLGQLLLRQLQFVAQLFDHFRFRLHFL